MPSLFTVKVKILCFRVSSAFNPEHLVMLLVGPISHTGTQYMDFVKTFNISLDLSAVYFAHFSGC